MDIKNSVVEYTAVGKRLPMLTLKRLDTAITKNTASALNTFPDAINDINMTP